jgi:hypothetical protein
VQHGTLNSSLTHNRPVGSSSLPRPSWPSASGWSWAPSAW